MKSLILRRSLFFIYIILFFFGASAQCHEKKDLTVEWIHSKEAGRIASVPFYKWLKNNRLLIMDDRKLEAEQTFKILDPKSGKSVAVLDMQKALASLEEYIDGKKIPKTLSAPLRWMKQDRMHFTFLMGTFLF